MKAKADFNRSKHDVTPESILGSARSITLKPVLQKSSPWIRVKGATRVRCSTAAPHSPLQLDNRSCMEGTSLPQGRRVDRVTTAPAARCGLPRGAGRAAGAAWRPAGRWKSIINNRNVTKGSAMRPAALLCTAGLCVVEALLLSRLSCALRSSQACGGLQLRVPWAVVKHTLRSVPRVGGWGHWGWERPLGSLVQPSSRAYVLVLSPFRVMLGLCQGFVAQVCDVCVSDCGRGEVPPTWPRLRKWASWEWGVSVWRTKTNRLSPSLIPWPFWWDPTAQGKRWELCCQPCARLSPAWCFS